MRRSLRGSGARVPAFRPAGRFRGIRPSRFAGHHAGPLAWLALLVLGPIFAAAAEPAASPAVAAPAASPLRYRRVFLPSEAIRKLESSALRDEAFVPLRREEFERLLGAVGTKYSAPQAASSPQISQAVYTAFLNGELLVGTARLTIVPGADPGAVLSLEPSNLVVTNPVWMPAPTANAPASSLPPATDSSGGGSASTGAVPGDSANSVPAVAWGCDDTGRMVAVVNAPGVLQFAWSRRAVRDASGELTFDLRLPLASVNQLQLSLRRNWRPAADAAVVSAVEQENAGDAAEQTWLIEIRGDKELKLRLAPSSEPPLAQPLTLLRQEQRYAVAPDAAEVTIRLRLDVHQQPLSELTLQMEDPLQLYRAYYRDTPLSWTESVSGPQRRVTLALPEPVLGDGHEIRLQAIAAVRLGTDWRLPRVSVPGVFWLEGVSRLDVSEPLRLAHLETTGGRQTRATLLPAPQRGESVEIREFQPQAKIVALLQHGGGEKLAQTVTSVKLGTTATTVVHAAQLTCSGSPQYQVELNLAPGWTVDLVQTEPPDALEDWRPVGGGSQNRSVQIHFRSPLSADRPLGVTLYAHRRGIRIGERVHGRDLRLGNWRDTSVTRSLMTIAADPSHQVALSGDIRLKRLAIEELSAWEKDRTQAAAGAVMYVEDAAAEELNVALLEEAPSYSAEINIDATYREKWAEQVFRLRCQPLASKVARLIVHFSEPLQTPLRWALSGEDEVTVLARPLGGGEEAGQPSSRGNAWELVLPRARDDSFELVTTHAETFAETANVPLVSVPEAASQVGYVTIHSATLPLDIEPQNVRPIPAEPGAPGSYSTTRGAYRFDPSLDCRLTVRIAGAVPGCDSVWAERAELSTRVLGAGQALHTVLYRLENRGRAQAVIGPPPGAEVLEILVNGRPVSWSRQATTRAGVAVDLPRGDRYPAIVVRYTTRFLRRGPWADVEAPWPDPGMPVFERHWVVWLPPGWQIESPAAAAEADWSTRLFGPLVRSPQHQRFDPRSAQHWASLKSLTDPPRDSAAGPVGAPAWSGLADESPRPSWQPADADFPNQGWTAVGVPIGNNPNARRPATEATPIHVVQHDFFRAVGWAAFLTTAGLMVWTTRRRPLWCLPLSAVWGGLALGVPATWVPVANGCFLGSVLAVLIVWLPPQARRSPAPASGASAGSSRVILAPTTTALLVFLAVLLAAATAVAQPIPAPPTTETGKVFRVLFPVDDEQQPMEPYVYVPRDFSSYLRRETTGGGTVARQWLIAGADYRVVFELDAASPAPLARELVAQYRVRTSRADARLVLPIRQDQVYLLPNRARLDGRPASVAWESEGRMLIVEVPEPGEADLELAFRPQIEIRDGAVVCDVQIPRVPDARLRLQLPAGISGVECLSALGNTTTEATGEQLISLGPADHLTLQWAANPAANAGAVSVEAEQLMWLRVRPGAAVLQARFRFNSAAGRLQEIGVLASPRLRLLPHREPGRVPVVSVPDGENQRLRWSLRPPSAQDVTLDLEFVLADVSGIGIVRMPRLEALATRTTRRWLGVSVDESLSYTVPPEGQGEAVDPVVFATAWEPATVPPQLAVAIGEGEPVWSLATQPQAVTVKAAQQLQVAWGAERIDLQFQAQLETIGGGVFEYRLTVPAGLEITSASLRDQDEVRAARWMRSEENTLILRWDRPVSGKHQLELRASRPASQTAEQALERITLQGAEVVSDAVRLYRRASVRVNVLDRAGLSDVPETPVDQYQPGWGRLVAALQAPPDQTPAAPLRVHVVPNRPRPQGTLVTILDRTQDAWQVQVQYDLRVTAGLIGAVRWEIPAEWTGPLTCDCPGDLEVVTIPGQKRRHLVLRPHKAIAASRRLNISGRLSTPQGETVQAPDIIPLDVETADRYVCAPTQINQQGIAWKTSGLREISELPAGFEVPAGPHKIFVATQPRFRATIADVQPTSGPPQVVLADLAVTCGSDGELAGTATFDLQPSGIDGCDLQLPEGYQLVDVAVGGLPAMLASLGPQQWRLTFGPRQLAQQIQVVFSGRMAVGPPGSGRCTIRRPQLAGIPVKQTLWTIRTVDPAPLEVFPARDRVAPITLEFLRFATRAELIESGSETLAASDPMIAARWYSGWLQRLTESKSTIDQWLAARPEFRTRYAKELQEIEAGQTELDEKLKSLPQPARTEPEPMVPRDPSWQQASRSVDDRGEVAALVTNTEAVDVEFRPVTNTVAEQRGAAAAVLLALATVAWMLLPHPALHRYGSALVPLAGIVLGAIWWAWFTPSILGLALGLFSLLVGLTRLASHLVPSAARSPQSTQA